MVVSNRLVALIFRSVFLAVSIFCLAYFMLAYPSSDFLVFLNFDVTIAVIVLFGLEVIFNAIDLRHGINGVASGAHQSVALCITGLSLAVAIGYNAVQAPLGEATYTIPDILIHILIPAMALADWLAFDLKGTAKWSYLFYWMMFPLIYAILVMWIRPILGGAAVNGESIYPYSVLEPATYASSGNWMASNDGWSGVFFALAIWFLGMAGLFAAVIFFDNLMAGRYLRHSQTKKS